MLSDGMPTDRSSISLHVYPAGAGGCVRTSGSMDQTRSLNRFPLLALLPHPFPDSDWITGDRFAGTGSVAFMRRVRAWPHVLRRGNGASKASSYEHYCPERMN